MATAPVLRVTLPRSFLLIPCLDACRLSSLALACWQVRFPDRPPACGWTLTPLSPLVLPSALPPPPPFRTLYYLACWWLASPYASRTFGRRASKVDREVEVEPELVSAGSCVGARVSPSRSVSRLVAYTGGDLSHPSIWCRGLCWSPLCCDHLPPLPRPGCCADTSLYPVMCWRPTSMLSHHPFALHGCVWPCSLPCPFAACLPSPPGPEPCRCLAPGQPPQVSEKARVAPVVLSRGVVRAVCVLALCECAFEEHACVNSTPCVIPPSHSSATAGQRGRPGC